jgi:hypothetical protein
LENLPSREKLTGIENIGVMSHEVKGSWKTWGASRIHNGNLGGDFLLNYSLLLFVFLTMSIDCYLDGDRSSTDVLALESGNGLRLFILIADIDETVALALAGATVLPADNTSRNDVDAGFGEESSESGIIDVETEVGNKEHRLGGFASGFFACSATGTESVPLAGRLRLALRDRDSRLGFAINSHHGGPRFPLIECGVNVGICR